MKLKKNKSLNKRLLFLFFSQTAKDRFTSEEARALDRANTYLYHEVRQASEAHRQVLGYNMGHAARKPVFGVSGNVIFKPAFSATETS